MAILKVANIHHDASGFARTQITTANNITWHTAGVEGMRLDSTGNLLIGRTSSNSGKGIKLDVVGTINASNILINGAAISATAGAGATGAGGDQIFYENMQNVTTTYTITTNRNAMTTGPVTINSGVTVTVPSGSRWVVL